MPLKYGAKIYFDLIYVDLYSTVTEVCKWGKDIIEVNVHRKSITDFWYTLLLIFLFFFASNQIHLTIILKITITRLQKNKIIV